MWQESGSISVGSVGNVARIRLQGLCSTHSTIMRVSIKYFFKLDAESCYNATIGNLVNKFNDLRLLQSCYIVAFVANTKPNARVYF